MVKSNFLGLHSVSRFRFWKFFRITIHLKFMIRFLKTFMSTIRTFANWQWFFYALHDILKSWIHGSKSCYIDRPDPVHGKPSVGNDVCTLEKKRESQSELMFGHQELIVTTWLSRHTGSMTIGNCTLPYWKFVLFLTSHTVDAVVSLLKDNTANWYLGKVVSGILLNNASERVCRMDTLY